jgi:hypothetical protein
MESKKQDCDDLIFMENLPNKYNDIDEDKKEEVKRQMLDLMNEQPERFYNNFIMVKKNIIYQDETKTERELKIIDNINDYSPHYEIENFTLKQIKEFNEPTIKEFRKLLQDKISMAISMKKNTSILEMKGKKDKIYHNAKKEVREISQIVDKQRKLFLETYKSFK